MIETAKQLGNRIAKIAAERLDGQLTNEFKAIIIAELVDWKRSMGITDDCTHPLDGLEVIRSGGALMVQCTRCMRACLTDQDIWEPVDVVDGMTGGEENRG